MIENRSAFSAFSAVSARNFLFGESTRRSALNLCQSGPLKKDRRSPRPSQRQAKILISLAYDG